MRSYELTSESVTEGHPDKICDQVSDAILDAALEQDPESRVAIETLIKNDNLVIAGELTTRAELKIGEIGKNVVESIGYPIRNVSVYVTEQSPDISIGVTQTESKEQGAGDQGFVGGYAVNETTELMPLPIMLAHKLTYRLSEVRKNKTIHYLKPDGKSQVTILYENGFPIEVTNIVVSSQHKEGVDYKIIYEDILENVIKPVCGSLISNNTTFYINPTGSFVRGGPEADSGVTGRKIIADTYGGAARHGGGAFSGKDSSKVDRSGAYSARYLAKNIVAAGLANRCEVQIAYSIGIAEPVSLYIECFATEKFNFDSKLEDKIRSIFPLKPADIINKFELKKPIYRATACYGHFGRDGFPWEKTDKVEELKKLLL